MEMLVNTIRMVDYDQAKEYSEGSDNSIKEKLAIGFLNPGDYKTLNIKPNLNIKLSSKFGSVVIKGEEVNDVPLGMINMPVSIWANQITGIENNELLYKNIVVKVEITKDSIPNLKDLLNSIKDK